MAEQSTPKLQNLSEPLARTLPPGEYQDKTQKALYFYVSPKGTRSYGFYKWSSVRGQPIRKSLGKWPATRAEDARKAANQLASQVENGEDVGKKPKPKGGDPKLTDLLTAYSAKLKQERRIQWKWAEKAVTFHASDWLELPFSKITREMMVHRERLISHGDDKTKPRGDQAGALFIKAMRALYAYAEKEQGYQGKNLAKQVDKEPSAPRERILSAVERGAVLAALDSPRWSPHVRPYFRLLMVTGARRSNMSGALKSQIDLPSSLWTVPAGRSKNGYEMKIHLSAEAVQLFQEQFDRHPDSPWVFPTPSGSASGHLEEVWPVWKQVLAEAGVDLKITVHDLRRSYGSLLLNNEVPMEVVSKLLGHRTVATTAKHYAFVSPESAAMHLKRVLG